MTIIDLFTFCSVGKNKNLLYSVWFQFRVGGMVIIFVARHFNEKLDVRYGAVVRIFNLCSVVYVTATSPTLQYCYKGTKCDTEGVTISTTVVTKENCCNKFGGYSWGLYGGECRICPGKIAVIGSSSDVNAPHGEQLSVLLLLLLLLV